MNLHIFLWDKDSWKETDGAFATPSIALNGHIFIDDRKSIQDFVEESMKYLEEKEIL